MRKRRLIYNVIASFIYQITTIICGFILPRIMLVFFGSEVNGLVNSITQFLQVITFLDMGVGAVVQSSLYKPLAQNDNKQISKIYKSANNFYRRIAEILFVYVFILVLMYPLIASQSFGFAYISKLIFAMSISSFAQYYFGSVNRLLLLADQRGYIAYNIQTITLIINVCVCVLLIYFGMSIQCVKLVTSLIYLIRPLALRLYVSKQYNIDRKIIYESEPLKQRWHGLAQHVAAVVIDSTDIIVLTFLSTLSNISIYSVYCLVTTGVKQLLMSMTNGIQALIGEMWAKQEVTELYNFFGWVEWLIHTGTVLMFGCTCVLITSFVQVFTIGVADADYIQPLFAFLIVIANALFCLRLPYVLIILAAGHYKESQNIFIVSALINITLSIILVNIWGLIGVAIGTLVAMLYQTVWMAHYISEQLIKWPFHFFCKQLAVDITAFGIIILTTTNVHMTKISYPNWAIMGGQVFIISMTVLIIVNYLFYNDKLKNLFSIIMKKLV